MTTVVYHSADFDGVFCREVAKRALGEDGVPVIRTCATTALRNLR